jgi:hypothetical protein
LTIAITIDAIRQATRITKQMAQRRGMRRDRIDARAFRGGVATGFGAFCPL